MSKHWTVSLVFLMASEYKNIIGTFVNFFEHILEHMFKHLFYCKYHEDLQEGNSPWIALFGGMHSYTNMTLGLGLPIMLCLVKWNVYLTASVIKKPSSHLDPDLNLSCLERNIFFRQTETKTKIIVKNKNN